MNEPNPEIIPAEPPALPAYKDRSTGLMVFGIFTILSGCLAGLFVLLMLVGVAAAAKNPNSPQAPMSGLLLAMAIYAGLAVALIWLGIGSIKARRWARALLLIFSWMWLVMGIFMTGFSVFVMPKVFANLPADTTNGRASLPPEAATGIMVVMFITMGVLFVLLPAIWTFFYSSRHVKATCEARDPVKRWTDACPLPVLGLSLCLMCSAPMMLAAPFMSHGVFPFFGIFLSGLPGSLVYVGVATLWAYSAYLLYRTELRGWWLTLITMVLYLISSLVTFARHDSLEMYQRMGYPQAQIDQMQKMGVLAGNHMEWSVLFFAVPFVGYLLFVKQYLKRKT